MNSVFVVMYMLSLLCLPPTLAAIELTSHELVSLLDELPSLQALVLHYCDISSYVSCFFSVQSAVDTLCVCYYLLCTLTGW